MLHTLHTLRGPMLGSLSIEAFVVEFTDGADVYNTVYIIQYVQYI